MKNQITFSIVGIILVVLGIFAVNYLSKPKIPTVGPNGKIDGNYAIEGIMRLGKPYVCTFEKSDDASMIAGVIHTDGQKIYGEFRIKTDLIENDFNSFLIVKDGETYNWTSLQNVGYKSQVAKSASKNASPQEQAQIVGTQDKMEYRCELWSEVDDSLFEAPTWVTFSELKK